MQEVKFEIYNVFGKGDVGENIDLVSFVRRAQHLGIEATYPEETRFERVLIPAFDKETGERFAYIWLYSTGKFLVRGTKTEVDAWNAFNAFLELLRKINEPNR